MTMAKVPICSECGKEIPLFGKYRKNDKTGQILCILCFDKKVKEGEIT